jgi:hypothetical protein
MFDFIFLVQRFEPGFGGFVHLGPHATDDLGHLGNLGIGVFALDILIDFLLVQEKGGEGFLGRVGLR